MASSPRLILSLIRHLPEGSIYAATLQSAPAEDVATEEPPAEPDPAYEAQLWTTDRMLQAQLINSVNMLIRHSIDWKDGKAPELPIIGPAKWRDEGPNATPSKPLTVMDVINNVMGHHG